MKLCKIILLVATLCFSLARASEDFEKKLLETASEIPEFVWIQKEAQKHGLKVWLFGGSAASFAHYVKELAAFENGSKEYYPESFARDAKGNLDYTDIFRPTQDMDLVADGPVEKIRDFERVLLAHYPHLRGSKQRYEVRSLRENYGDKAALLDNFNFRRQHTDSHSVGLISLDPKDKQPVKDLFDWKAKKPKFLKDVLDGKLHFYYGEKHKETERYKEGKNPPIFSVIRYFIKLFQHELEPRSEDLRRIKRIIRQTKRSEDGYVENWLNQNVPKLFLHARNVEYAAEVLEETGLKEKLLKLEGQAAIWANKEPLRSFPLGQGEGKTARELEIKTVAHDTRDFFTWTVITRSRKGEPNVLISRENTPGENAIYGDGFYTVKNQSKGYGNGFSIRFKVNPKAREGADFRVYEDFILILNKNAIRVIPESIRVPSLLAYFKLIAEGGFKEGDEGLLEKLKRKLERRPREASKKNGDKIIAFLKKEKKKHLWREWLSFKISSQYPELAESFIELVEQDTLQRLAEQAFSRPHWGNHPRLIELVIERGNEVTLQSLALRTFSSSFWTKHPRLVELFMKKADKYAMKHAMHDLIYGTFARQPAWTVHPYLVESLIKESDQERLQYLAQHLFSQAAWVKHPRLLKLIIDKGNQLTLNYLGIYTFSQVAWTKYPELLERVIKKANQKTLKSVFFPRYVFSQEAWLEHPRLIELTRGAGVTVENLAKVLKKRNGCR